MTDATCKQSLQVQLESAQQDAESWRLAYLGLLDRVLAAGKADLESIVNDLREIKIEWLSDISFGNTTPEARAAYQLAISDAYSIAMSPRCSRPLPSVRVLLKDGTMVRAVVIGERGPGCWSLSAPGIGRFLCDGNKHYRIHPEDLARLEGAK